jgi:ABC transport system ATP-binding/permease protein
MSVLRLSGASLAFGHRPLLAGADFDLARGDRVALVGRNGTGKSSLLRILSGDLEPDSGFRWVADGTRISLLPQEVPRGGTTTIYETVAEGLGGLGAALAEFHRLSSEGSGTATALSRLGELQSQIERDGGWNAFHRVEAMLSRWQLPADKPIDQCSGGMRRLALLARTWVAEPDILLLDEPTNHLDIDAIAKLEAALQEFDGALVLVSHDRALIRRVATRITDLDRGKLRDYPGDYDLFLDRRAGFLESEARADALLDRNLAEEEAWLRQGIRARRTRNEGRVRRLHQMRRERAERLAPAGSVTLRLDRGAASGALVVELDDVRFSYPHDAEPVIAGFSTTVVRGDRIGIIGPNGCGKSTLLRLMQGELAPSAGTVRMGTGLQVAYFDQQRAALDPEQSVRDNVADGADHVEVGGRRRHVVGYLGDFLFDPARVSSPVETLSGGERNRLLLARLFARPANLLVLDEPTNDLDIETLELLESLVGDYDGTLLLVSHDREFLDAVVTSIIAFEGGGVVREHAGGYSDWARYRASASAAHVRDAATSREPSRSGPARTEPSPGEPAGTGRASRPRRLGFREQRELAELPDRISELEQALAALQAEVSEPGFYQQDQTRVRAGLDRLAELEVALTAAYERWSELEDRA